MSEGGPANGKITLHAVTAALAEVERGVAFQHLGPIVVQRSRVANWEHLNGAVDFFERRGFERARDHNNGLVFRHGWVTHDLAGLDLVRLRGRVGALRSGKDG